MNKLLSATILALAFTACTQKPANHPNQQFNKLAEEYVRLGLYIGQYDAAFVDAYYGPDSLRPDTNLKVATFPKDSLLAAIKNLSDRVTAFAGAQKNDTLAGRANWMQLQLNAFARRVHIFSNEFVPFEQECKDLFGVTPPQYPEDHFKSLVAQLDSLLPGKGNRNERFQQLANRFIISKDRLDTVFKTAIAECRKRTLKYFQLPQGESFELEFVNNKPWNGYNWYKGNYHSTIQINTDLNIFIERAIDVGSHESYPGHHVYNMLLEKNLYRDKGWVEISLYPLFSPQSFIAEGTANYGIEMAFPGNEKVKFASEVLLPLAGLDTTGITLYFKALEIKGKLNYVRNEVARGLLNNTMAEATGMQMLMDYALFNKETAAKSIAFIKANRSYVINYNYGMDLAKEFIEKRAGNSTDKRWEVFGWILSNPVTPAQLAQQQ
ncbi:MAG TPA: hypothetical protein VD996_18000 [Chitinophagaceae bacterium]|nr:hypothetical protein [Chitinophagaceae bacterium]